MTENGSSASQDGPARVNKLAVHTAQFWDEAALLAEQQRQFDVCHGCRLCFNLCPAFPALFNATDAAEDAGGLALTREALRPVEAQCYQCQLCYLRCPYTEPHDYNLDVPALFLRANFVNARKEGVGLADRLLADTDRLGGMGSKTAPLANAANRIAPLRFAAEKTMGVHRKAALPVFSSQTFASWFGKNRERLHAKLERPTRKAALFYTCYLNYWGADAAIACAEVFTHNNIELMVPKQQCCGMPFMDTGVESGVQRKIDANLPELLRAIDDGYDIVTPGPSCGMMLRRDWPQLREGAETRRVAAHTLDVSEYLWKLRAAGDLDTGFQSKLGKVAYHAPCHQRMQFIGNKGADLMRLVPDTEVEIVDRCSHHDGTWGMKKNSHEVSLRYGKRLFDDMNDAEADLFVSDCPLAAEQIHQGAGRRPEHTMQALRRAYGI